VFGVGCDFRVFSSFGFSLVSCPITVVPPASCSSARGLSVEPPSTLFGAVVVELGHAFWVLSYVGWITTSFVMDPIDFLHCLAVLETQLRASQRALTIPDRSTHRYAIARAIHPPFPPPLSTSPHPYLNGTSPDPRAS